MFEWSVRYALFRFYGPHSNKLVFFFDYYYFFFFLFILKFSGVLRLMMLNDWIAVDVGK